MAEAGDGSAGLEDHHGRGRAPRAATASPTDLDRMFGLGDDRAWIARAGEALRADDPAGRLGEYEDLHEIGRGGQGTVYRARQPLTGRTVAIKRIGLASGDRRAARFEREVEAVSRLAHPNVVAVFGAQVIDGHAVIVMEYVEGVAIDEWAADVRREQGAASWREIVRACLGVCEGVAHAHQRGVIHRDLKPSNVVIGADGRARVLDFGIARVLDGGGRATDTGFAGTPQFASPEHVAGREVDVRSDVYSLGLLVYELVSGERAFGGAHGLAALMDAIRTGVDARLSRRVRGVPRDLDWVMLRATATDPDRRYATVEALARDLRAVLAGGVVEAHPPSVAYALAKGVRRHRVPATIAATIGLALGATWVMQWRSSIRVQRALDDTSAALVRESDALRAAQAQMLIQAELERLFRRVLGGGNATQSTGDPDMTIREAVNNAVAFSFGPGSEMSPQVEGTLRAAVGEVYLGMGLYEQGFEHLLMAHERLTATYGDSDERAIEPLLRMSQVMRGRGDYAAALETQQRIVDVRRRQTEGYAQVNLAQALNALGITQRRLGMLEDSERSQLEALEHYLARVAPDHESVGLVRASLSTLYVDMGRLDDAEREARLSVQIMDSIHPGGRHRDCAGVRRALGEVLAARGELEEAEAVLRQAVAVYRSDPDAAVIDASRAMMALGDVLVDRGARQEGIELLREGLAGVESVYPPTNPRVVEARDRLERALDGTGTAAEGGAATPR